MANYCNNNFTVSHNDAAMLDRFEAAFKAGQLFDEFIPMPQELKDGDSPCQDKALKAHNIEAYGAEDWYYWAYQHWGVKRDIELDGGDIKRDGANLNGWFNSPWNPPEEGFRQLGGMGFQYELKYDELWAGFVGILAWDGRSLRDECVKFSISDFKTGGPNWRHKVPLDIVRHLEEQYDRWVRDMIQSQE